MKSSSLFVLLSATLLVASAGLVVSQLPPGIPTIPPQYGSMEAFSQLNSNQYWPNTPVPEACPQWVKEDFGVIEKIMQDAIAMSPATAKSLWNSYNLSPKISPSFSIDAFMDVITGAVTVSDDFTNNSIFIEYTDMKNTLAAMNLWSQYGAGKNPQCLVMDAAWTIPPMPTDLLSTTLTTPYDGPTDPPMPTDWFPPAPGSGTGEPSGGHNFPTYEPGTIIMMIDTTTFPGDQQFLNALQQYVNFPTSYLHVHDDIRGNQKLITNATLAQAQLMAAFTTKTLNALGVIYIRIADGGDNFPSANDMPESDYQILINITASFERANPLPNTCPAYLTNDTLLSQKANVAYPPTTAASLFGPIYGKEFDGFNTTCLYLFWEQYAGQAAPNCPADFANIFPTLPGAGGSNSGFPSGTAGPGDSGMPSNFPSDMPSGNSNMPSGTSDFPSGAPSSMPSGGSSNMPSSGSPSDMPSGSPSSMPSGGSSNMPSSGSPSDMPTGGSSNMPSGGNSNMPSGGSMMNSNSPGSAPPIVTSPSDALNCKVPFQDYAPCVLAQNTMGIILYLRDIKAQLPECFCKGAECVTAPPSTMNPIVTQDENGSIIIPTETLPSLPPMLTQENETFPANMSFPPVPTFFNNESSDIPSDMPSGNQSSDIPSDFPMPSSGTPGPTPPGQTTQTGNSVLPSFGPSDMPSGTPGPTPPGQTTQPGGNSGLPSFGPSDMPSGPPVPTPPGQTTQPGGNSDMPSGPPIGPTATAGPNPTGPPPPTAPPGVPTTTTVYDNPNTVAFTKGSGFSMDNFQNKLASALGIPTTYFTAKTNPFNSSQVIVVFNTGNRGTDATLKQRALNLSQASLTEMGATGAAAASNEGAYTTTVAPGAGPVEEKANMGPIIGGIIGAVVVLGAVGFYIYRNNNKSRTAATGGDSYAAHQDFNDFRGNVNASELGSINNNGAYSPKEHSV